MKIALLGKGKTGSYVIELAREQNIDLEIFDRQRALDVNVLKNCDVVISFVPGEAFLEMIPSLLESKMPVVSGSTGLEISEKIKKQIKEQKLYWLHAHNFALGMSLVREMILTLKRHKKLFSKVDVSIHEVHHVHKKDAPSGTALSWKEWIGGPCKVSSERTGDVVGDHQIVFETENEKISLRHEALDRRIFAEGALWAAKTLLNNKDKLEPRLYTLNELTQWATKG